MKKILTSIGILILLFGIIILSNNTSNKIEASVDLLSYQDKMDNKINNYLSKGYTIKNPKIILNPYKISPLTCLVILSTNEDIKVYLNDEYITTYKKNKNLIIPIMYLEENKNNKITLEDSKNKYDYYVKTDKIIDNKINFSTKTKDNYLISSPDSSIKHSIIDYKGDLIWYLDLDTNAIIEPTDHDTFLIGVEEYTIKNNISSYTGIYEIDYMGKIIKRYDTPYGYHHQIKYVDNEHVYILGSTGSMNIIYCLNLNKNKITKVIDINSILIENNKELKNYLNNLKLGLGTNSIDLSDDNMLVSLRNIDTIINFNYKTNKLNYVISNDSIINKSLKEYTLKHKYILRGMHDVKFIDNKTISIYNNSYSYLTNKTSSAEALIVKNEKKESKVLKQYKYEHKYSYAYGSMDVGSKVLVNYSYMYKNKNFDPLNDKTYSNIILYRKNKIINKLTIDANIYKAKIYNYEYNKPYKLKEYNYYNLNKPSEEVDIHNSIRFENIFKFTDNTIETTISDDLYHDLIVIFKGKEDYYIKYNKVKTYHDIKPGLYKVFIEMDGHVYNLNTTVSFDK